MTFTITSPEGKKLTLRPSDPLYRFRTQIRRNQRVARVSLALRNLGLASMVFFLLLTMSTHSIGLFIVMLLVVVATIIAGVVNYLARQIAASLGLSFSRSRAFEARNLHR